MATQTHTLASFDDGNCTWSMQYDDVRLLITQIACVNNSAEPTRGSATVQATGHSFTALVDAGGSLTQVIPTGQANRLDLTVDSRGRPDGIDYTFQWGAGTV